MEKTLIKNRNSNLQSRENKSSWIQYRIAKTLPHIKEQFHFQVQNQLLIEKITRPKRDKLIMNSLIEVSRHKNLRKQKHKYTEYFGDNGRKKFRDASEHRENRPKTSQNRYKINQNMQNIQPSNSYQVCEISNQSTFGRIKNQQEVVSQRSRLFLTDTENSQYRFGKIIKNIQNRRFQPHNLIDSVCKTEETASLNAQQNDQNIKQKLERKVQRYFLGSFDGAKKLPKRLIQQNIHQKQNKMLIKNGKQKNKQTQAEEEFYIQVTNI